MNNRINERIPLTEIDWKGKDIIIGKYTFIADKTELIGKGGTCLVYRTYMKEASGSEKRVILKEFYPVVNNESQLVERNEDGSFVSNEMNETGNDYKAKKERFLGSYDMFNTLHNEEETNNFIINAMDIVNANNTVYIVADYDYAVGLDEYITLNPTLNDFLNILGKSANAIGHLHEQGYLHLDITPSNIVVFEEDKYVKLIDTDSITEKKAFTSAEEAKKVILSFSNGYSAPELCQPYDVRGNFEYRNLFVRHCEKADIFSIGAIFYRYLYGKKLDLTDSNGKLVTSKVENEIKRYEYKKSLKKVVRDKHEYCTNHILALIDTFIEKCISYSQVRRYQSMKEVVEALEEIQSLTDAGEHYIQEKFVKNANKVYGREEKLEELTELINRQGKPEGKKSRIAYISGVGGIGKSTLAKMYAEENVKSYDTVVEVNAESAKEALLGINIINYDLNELDEIRKAAYEDDDKFAYWKRIMINHMSKNPLLLIVHDYMEDKRGERKDYEIWKDLPCDVIITTRDRGEEGKTISLNWKDLSSESAVDIFYEYYVENAISRNDAEEEEMLKNTFFESKTVISELVDTFDRHPYAIKVLAKQMSEGGFTPEYMLSELKKYGMKHKEGAEFINSGIDLNDHNYGENDAYGHIRGLFDITSMNGKMSDAEKEILRYMIIVPSEYGISVGRLKNWCNLGEETYGYMKKLCVKGWLERVEGGKDYLYTEEYEKKENNIRSKMVYRMPMVISEALKEQEDMVPTVDNVGTYLDEFIKLEVEKKKDIQIRKYVESTAAELGRYLKYEEDEEYAKVAIQIGDIYENRKQYTQALEFYEKVLRIYEKVRGEEHKEVLQIYIKIGDIYCDRKDYEKSLEYYEKALSIIKKVYGEEHKETAMIYNNKACVYRWRKDYEKSLEYYEKALSIIKKVYGEEHEEAAMIYNNIGIVYSWQKDYEKSLEYYEKALNIRKKVYGEEHEETAYIYNNIGFVYSWQKKYEKSLEYYEKALNIRKRVYGDKHEETAKVYKKISKLRDITYADGVGEV